MNEQSAPDFPLPYTPEQHPPKKLRNRRKLLILAFGAAGLIVVAATSAYLWMSRPADSGSASTIRSVTYYYRDGKTVLWQGARLAEQDSPTFVHAAADDLIKKFGEDTMQQAGEWKIVTTLDQSLQQAAKQQIEAQRAQLQRQRAQDAALVAQEVTTGQIVAWAGSLDDKVFYNGFDRLSTRAQPGSLAMPLVYAAWMDNNTGIDANTMVADEQKVLPGYPCLTARPPQCLKNYDRKYQGQIPLRQALAGLRTVPAVQAMVSVVPNDTSLNRTTSINKAITSIESMIGGEGTYTCYKPGTDLLNLHTASYESRERSQCYTSAAIGDGVYAKPGKLINAFATLAHNGKLLPQTFYLTLQKDGKILDKWKQADGRQVIKTNTANIINDILSDKTSSYLGRKSYFSINGETKVGTITGVTDDSFAYGAVQYTARYAVGFWGFGSDTAPIIGFGQSFTLPATHGWLTTAHENDE